MPPSLLQPIFDPLLVAGKRKGGWVQQCRHAREERQRAERPGNVSSYSISLLQDWAEGWISAPRLHRHAWRLKCDAEANQTVLPAALARLSSISSTPGDQNCHAGLLKLLGETCDLKRLISVVESPSPVGRFVEVRSLLKELHRNTEVFKVRLGARKHKVASFWKDLFNSEQGAELKSLHPHLKDVDVSTLSTCIPIVIHEDAAPFTKNKSAATCSWYGLLGTGSEIQSKFIHHSFVKKTDDTWMASSAVWEHFFGELDLLFAGYDENGVAFIEDEDGVWRLCLLFSKGDGEQQVVVYGMPGYSLSGRERGVCGYCDADRVDKPFTDLSIAADWRPGERMANALWLARVRKIHPLSSSRHFHRLFNRLDGMHNLDCKGTAAIVGGSVIAKVIREDRRLGNTIDERLAAVNAKLAQFNGSYTFSSKISDIRRKNLFAKGTDQWITLHGPTIKAAGTRHIMPFVQLLAEECFDDGSPYSNSIIKVCRSLNGIYDVLYTADMFLTDGQHKQLSDRVMRFGKHFNACRGYAKAQRCFYFNTSWKVHQTMHLPYQAALINPRHMQCYNDESLQGRAQRIWGKVAGPSRTIPQQEAVLYKYLVSLIIALNL